MSLTRDQLATRVQTLVGDPNGTTYSPNHLSKAIEFSIREYAKKTGATYQEVTSYYNSLGLVPIPTDSLKINRVILTDTPALTLIAPTPTGGYYAGERTVAGRTRSQIFSRSRSSEFVHDWVVWDSVNNTDDVLWAVSSWLWIGVSNTYFYGGFSTEVPTLIERRPLSGSSVYTPVLTQSQVAPDYPSATAISITNFLVTSDDYLCAIATFTDSGTVYTRLIYGYVGSFSFLTHASPNLFVGLHWMGYKQTIPCWQLFDGATYKTQWIEGGSLSSEIDAPAVAYSTNEYMIGSDIYSIYEVGISKRVGTSWTVVASLPVPGFGGLTDLNPQALATQNTFILSSNYLYNLSTFAYADGPDGIPNTLYHNPDLSGKSVRGYFTLEDGTILMWDAGTGF